MKYTGLDNKQYNINFNQYSCNANRSNKSKYHLAARELLHELFPANPIFEEVLLPGCKSKLYADFFIPTQDVIIEVHGEQHYVDNSFFYKSASDFISAKKRDRDKLDWCINNNLRYIELPYKESIDEWRTRLC